MSANVEEKFETVSITLQPEIIEMMDKIVAEKHISSRSELIRQAFGCYLKELLKQAPPEAGVYVDAAGVQVHVGLLDDAGKNKVASGQWKLLKSF